MLYKHSNHSILKKIPSSDDCTIAPKEEPSEQGYYWFKGKSPLTDATEPVSIVQIHEGSKALIVSDYAATFSFDLKLFEGEWSGPLIDPFKK